MVKIKCYSMEEALKRLHKGEPLFNISQGMEILYNGEPGKRKSDFNDDIVILRNGEYVDGFNKDFINEYMRLGGAEGCNKYICENTAILGRYTIKSVIDLKVAFEHIHSRIEPVFRPMTQFEMLGWADSDSSRGWLVRAEFQGYTEKKIYSQWLLPQHFYYDKSRIFDKQILSYERAKLLPDHSDIDKSTIQGFTVQDTHYEFFMETGKQKKHNYGYER